MTTSKDHPLTAPRQLLDDAATYAAEFLDGLPERKVAPSASAEQLRSELGGPLPEGPREPRLVVADLAKAVEPGLMATPGGRFFGFVIGGILPAALAADWLRLGSERRPLRRRAGGLGGRGSVRGLAG